MGILRSVVNINDLILLDEEDSPSSKKYKNTGAGKIKMSKSASISPEINLIGKTCRSVNFTKFMEIFNAGVCKFFGFS